MIKWKVQFFVAIENTKSEFLIQGLFWKIHRKGRICWKQKEGNDFKGGEQLKKENQKNGWQYKKQQFVKRFLQSLSYTNIQIYEKLGLLDCTATAFSVPLLAMVTQNFFQFFPLKIKQLQYKVEPDYSQLVFHFRATAIATFRIVDLFLEI